MKITVYENGNSTFEATLNNSDIINGSELFIGRDEDCHIILRSHQVSRHHALVFFKNGLFVKPISKTSEVRVDGEAIQEETLLSTMSFEIAHFIIKISDFDITTQKHENSDGMTEMLAHPNTPVIENEDETEIMSQEESQSVTEDDSEKKIEDENTIESDFNDDTTLVESTEQDFQSGEDDVEVENLDFSDSNDEFQEESFEDADFGNDFAGDGAEEDDDSSTQLLSSFAKYSLKIFGEHAPFDSFMLENGETKIGRDATLCQITLNDPEVSKVHAIIKKTLVNCTIEDNQSSNGIILNGERVNKAELTNGDEFIIGETSFTLKVASDLLDSESDRLMPVEEDQEVIIEEEDTSDLGFGEENDELDFSDDSQDSVIEEKSFVKKIWKDPKKRIYAIVGVLLLALLLFDSEEETPAPAVKSKEKVAEKKKEGTAKKFAPEILEEINQNYALATAKFNNNQFYEAKQYLDRVKRYDPNYKRTSSLDKAIKEALQALTRLKEEEALKAEKLLKEKRVKELVEKARAATKEKNVTLARSYFSQVYELDPNNVEITPLKIEIDDFEEKKRIKEQNEILKKAKRKEMENKLIPGKQLYLKNEWYKAISVLGKFLNDESIDDDLIKEATSMLKESKEKLQSAVTPLISKARSYKEGQDLKQAYETYGEVLKYEPSNEESLNERSSIFETLEKNSKQVFIEGLIKEDLSDFSAAKEKFEEVQQISPINSEYYNKATEKLKSYFEGI